MWQGEEGINNPCPPSWRLPNSSELDDERLSWSQNNSSGAYASTLKWVIGGRRRNTDGNVSFAGSNGFIWSSYTLGTNAHALHITSISANMASYYRAHGMSVRCVRNVE